MPALCQFPALLPALVSVAGQVAVAWPQDARGGVDSSHLVRGGGLKRPTLVSRV